MEVPLPWERILSTGRSWPVPRARYILTDFRLLLVVGREVTELALHDIRDVFTERSLVDRLLRTATLVVHGRDQRHPLVLRHIASAGQLAAILEILAHEPSGSIDPSLVHAALHWKPTLGQNHLRQGIAGGMAAATILFGLVIGVHGTPTEVVYPEDDAIYPGGHKRDVESITRFMEASVMPWARATLGPIVGGSERVTCHTCHGDRAQAVSWAMPGVAALPKPDLAQRGWERYSLHMDAQMRNAIYGYIAESDNQARAAYMREVVMPGMARLLGRPAYDFTRSYEHNRTHFAFGCYHCHQVH